MGKIINEELENKLQLKTNQLMADALFQIQNKKSDAEKNFYNENVHEYLQTTRVMPHVHPPRGILLPLPKNEWPDVFQDMGKSYPDNMTWPGFSTYCYASAITLPPYLGCTFFYKGYAVYEDTLVKCSFLTIFQMVERTINNEKIDIPEYFVIDPLADKNNKYPDCYIGIDVRNEYLERLMLSRGKINILELEVAFREKKLSDEIASDRLWEKEIGNAIQSQLDNAPSQEERDSAVKWIPGC